MKHLLFIISGFAFSMILFTTTSCDKNTDCKATITVVDSTGFVGNARVKLFANVKSSSGQTFVGDVKADGVTDDAGTVKFTFKLPAIFDISAVRVVGTKTLTGTAIIKLEEGKGIDKQVTIK